MFVTEVALQPVCGAKALVAFWLPLDLAASGALDGTCRYPATDAAFPAWTYQGHIILDLVIAAAAAHGCYVAGAWITRA